MSIVIDDPRLEQLAQQLAAAEGSTVQRLVRESLPSRAGRRGLTVHERPLRERLRDLAREVDALPARVPADRPPRAFDVENGTFDIECTGRP